MKTIIKYIGITLIALLVNLSCSEEFVETKPIALASEASFYTSMVAAEMATTVCYSNFCHEKVWDLSIMMALGSISSDEAEAGAGGKDDVKHYQRIDQLTHSPAEPEVLLWPYGNLYRTINYCNVAMEKLPLINAKMDKTYDANKINKFLGEARFLRAFNHFKLLEIFGGIPIIDHVLSPDEYVRPRNSISEVLNFCKSDLEIAIESLPTKAEWGPDNVGRASKGAAQALMAKVYLYESSYANYYPGDERFTGCVQKWDSALYWAEEVMKPENGYKLVGIDGERWLTWRDKDGTANTGGYQVIFMVAGDNNEEGIFEIQYANDSKANFPSRGNGVTNWCGVRRLQNLDPALQASNPDGVESFGWGWWCPTDFLVSQYEAGDPRYKATVMEETDSLLCYLGSDGGVKWRNPNFNILRAGTGLHRATRKYEASIDEFWGGKSNWQNGPVNMKLIRFADVVLWASEAAMMLNNNDKALEYINMVRTRARMSGNTDSPADLTGIITLDNIIHERLVELALEGFRFWDLVRWNKAVEYLNHTLANGDQVIFESPRNDFFPIPELEIGLSGGVIEQNPGW